MRAPLRLRVLGALLFAVLAAGCQATGGGTEAGIVVARIPFACGESARYDLQELDGTLVAEASFDVLCEGDTLLLEQSLRAAESRTGDGGHGAQDLSHVVADSGTLLPVSSSREATREDEQERWSAAYAPDLSAVAFTHETPAGETEERELRLRRGAYDNESALWLWRALDLTGEYDGQYVSVSAVNQSQITVRLTVVRRERVEVPAGAFDAWRLHVRSGRATRVAWIAVDPPHQLVQWDNGSEIFRLLSYQPGSRP